MTYTIRLLLLVFSISLLSTGCGTKTKTEDENVKLTGEVKIDGSSTVYPITEAVAEEYRTKQPDVKVTVGVSGTGGGFKKFSRGETDINDASRPVKKQEDSICT